jgi:uncharacterized membrane protein
VEAKMSFKTYTAIRMVIIIIMAGLIGWAVVNGNALIPVPVIIAALLILLLFRRRVKEVVVDERVYSIAEKASYLAFRIFGIAAAVIGAALIALGWESSSDLYKIGLTLAYAVCGLLVIYYIAHIYYNRKYSGKK